MQKTGGLNMILVLDDHPLVQQGIRTLLKAYNADEEIVCAGTLSESLSLMENNDIHMAFVDINLGRENGLDLLAWAKENELPTKMFIITSSSRQSDFYRARKLGADAYVLKDAFIDEIMYGLKVVERGGKFYSAALIDQMSESLDEKESFTALTRRETEVFLLLGEGDTNAEISKKLYISEGTTKKHISSILGKLHLQNRVEAALLASRHGSGSH